MNIKNSIEYLKQKKNLSADEMESVFSDIFSSKDADHLVKDFLIALYKKSETFEEILGAVRYLRKNGKIAECKSPDVMDCCGTGGDGKNTFNFSTAVAFVLAGAGCHLAKHGNRAMSSQCGAADILTALGMNRDTPRETMVKCIDEIGIGFLFAPHYYPLMKRVAAIRKAIPHRTIFNLLGPLLNPARVKKQLIGVFDAKFSPMMAEVLQKFGSESVVVVHSEDGMDEFSLTCKNKYSQLKDGKIKNLVFDPKSTGYPYCTENDLKGGAPEENAARLRLCLKGHSEPLDHVVHINAAWGLMVAGKADHFMDALLLAQESISGGHAYRKLEEFIEATG